MPQVRITLRTSAGQQTFLATVAAPPSRHLLSMEDEGRLLGMIHSLGAFEWRIEAA